MWRHCVRRLPPRSLQLEYTNCNVAAAGSVICTHWIVCRLFCGRGSDMRRRSGRKCIEMAKWVEPARLGTELARLSTELARWSTELARLSTELARWSTELARWSTELARWSTELARWSTELARWSTEPALVT